MSNNSNNNWGNAVGLMIAFVILGSIIKIFLPKDMDKELSSATVTFDEFIEMVTPRMLNRDSREEIMKVFALFDDDNTGAISFKNLKRVATELGTVLIFIILILFLCFT